MQKIVMNRVGYTNSKSFVLAHETPDTLALLRIWPTTNRNNIDNLIIPCHLAFLYSCDPLYPLIACSLGNEDWP
jgi:hypothetical protein